MRLASISQYCALSSFTLGFLLSAGSRFVENISSLILSFPKPLLDFGRKLYELLTLRAAATIVFFRTGLALDEEQVAGVIGAIYMGVGWFSTLMASCYNVFGHPLPQPLIENEVLTNEPVFEALFPYLSYIVNNSSFEVKHVFKPVMQHPG